MNAACGNTKVKFGATVNSALYFRHLIRKVYMADELLQTGQSAPDFELPASNGGQISLGGLRGTNVVLFIYPVDDTPG